jgi:hypothetical protein
MEKAGSMGKEEERINCIFHAGLKQASDDLCRRCDEFKQNEIKEWLAIDGIRSGCAKLREDCRKDISIELARKMTTKTFLLVIALSLSIIGGGMGLWLHAHEKQIDELKDVDKVALTQTTRDRESIRIDISTIRDIVIRLETKWDESEKRKKTP